MTAESASGALHSEREMCYKLKGEKVQSTRSIAEARIHVELAIGKIKNFKILSGNIPLSMKPILSRVFSVCAFLTNFQRPIHIPS